MEDWSNQCRVLLAGHQGAGKSSLLLRHVHEHFFENLVGEEHLFKVYEFYGDIVVASLQVTNLNLELDPYLPYISGLVILYDITNAQSFSLVPQLLEQALLNGFSKLFMVLAGTKCDLEFERSVSYEEGKDLADRFEIQFIETSAKAMINVDKLFIGLCTKIHKQTNPGRENI